MKILAIDPGSTESGFVVFCTTTNKVITFGKVKNGEVLKMRSSTIGKLIYKKEDIIDLTLIEKPDFISLGAGATVTEAIFWAGRFNQAFNGSITYGRSYLKRTYGLKNDSAVIAFIKQEYPGIHLTKDSWQAMLLVHAYQNNVIDTEKTFNKKKKKAKKKAAKQLILTDLELFN
jgi:hypothetical protein